ncbi:Mediator of RNA polymerase II transcription subunit 18 [Zea mays]|uniref:Mediator of RNA polymerase II transcription subunit 18 n=1 Tax=Zea mays TaxID=4577 RepID=A0A1D6H4F1_MAIZE|nr:Mediator of RNA polymerase II transcription subunit 18 [Zea mays]
MSMLLRFYSRDSLVSRKSVLGCMSSALKVGPI